MDFNKRFIVLFLLMLWLPVSVMLLSASQNVSESENRPLAARPAFTLSGDYPQQFETYFNDHFGLRDAMITTYQHIQKKWGRSSSEKALIGQNNWLFLADDGAQKDYRHEDLFTAQDLTAWRAALQEKQRHVLRQQRRFLYVIAPNKGTIYPEFLPDDIPDDVTTSRRQQLLASLRADVPILDLTPTLRQAKQQQPVYYHTDTHWNLIGAFHAAVAIAQQLQLKTSSPMPTFRMQTTLGGDVAFLLGLQHEWTESMPIPSAQPTCTPALPIPTQPLLNTTKAHKMETFRCRAQGLHTLVIHDSFGVALKSFLPQYFATTTFVWDRPDRQRFHAMINRIQPDIVIEQRVERKLRKPPWGKVKKRR